MLKFTNEQQSDESIDEVSIQDATSSGFPFPRSEEEAKAYYRNVGKMQVMRKESFTAAHRLTNPEWVSEKNNTVFGKCNNENFHGHNYDLIVRVTGDIDPETGYVIDMKVLRDYIKEEVIDRFHQKNLNTDTHEFKYLNPTAENIAVVIWNLLRKKINTKHELKVVLYETERNFVEYPG